MFGLEKIGRKEKQIEKWPCFYCLVWQKSKEKKIERKNVGKIWVVMKTNFSFQIWEEVKGKFILNSSSKTT